MNYLSGVLALPEGSRLTGIGLRPLASESTDRRGTLYMHLVELADAENPSAAAGAVATFLPTALATIDGHQPDGSTWFAAFQLVIDDHDALRMKRAADAVITRALDLARVARDAPHGCPLTVDELHDAYADAGDVTEWALTHLLTGLLLELANIDLLDVVAAANTPMSAGDDPDENRKTQLQGRLMSWAATYEGPTV